MLTFLRNIQLEQPLAMKKSLFIVVAFVLLNGCSTISLVYRNAEWYLQHKIYGYTTFTDQQKEFIRGEISNYMAWHRKDALPEYIIFLQNLNGAAQDQGEMKAEEVALLRRHLVNLYQMTLAPAISPAAKILSTLDNRQIQELEKNLAEENQQQLNEQLEVSRDVYLNKRADKTISFLEWLAGDLNSRQEHDIRDMSRHLPVVNDIYLRHRQENQLRLIALLNGHAGEEKIAAFLSSWLFTPDETRSPEQQRAILAFEQASDDMVAHIQGMLTIAQKDHIHKVISSYIDDMRAELAASRQDSSQ
jgi:hypothetical protein